MVIPAIFVINSLDNKRFEITDKVVNHNIAINYKIMCYKKLPISEMNNLFLKSFILSECNFNKMNQDEKMAFLTL